MSDSWSSSPCFEIWNFSPSSQSNMKQCLGVVSKNETNKWLKKFGSYKDRFPSFHFSKVGAFTHVNERRETTCIVVSEDEDSTEVVIETGTDKSNINIKDENLIRICESIEAELSTGYNLLVNECLKNPGLLVRLVKILPITTLEKICNMFFDKNLGQNQFIEHVFKYFLPAYIQREYNCYTLELLLKCASMYPKHFKILIDEIIKDFTIPNKLLQDYVTTLSDCEQANYLMSLVNLDLTNDEFVHNLFSLYIAYKGCTKTDRIQNTILSLLYEHCDHCTMDKNYGRLLLAFLQTIKSLKLQCNQNHIEKILAAHRSPFHRPCLTIFNELKDFQQSDTDKHLQF